MALPARLACRYRRLKTNMFTRRGSRTLTSKPNEPVFPTRVFSGIQPTGIPHIGNYLGAIKNWVKIQDTYDDVIFSVVDLHSITLPQDPNTLRENIFSMVACLLACGINPDKSILFQQSQVLQHTELSWILGCLCTNSRLGSLPQWKEKKKKYVGVGLFTYPVLQSADILAYKATLVPVGEDQVTHIELTRDLAKSFNNSVETVFFPQPECLIGEVPRIKSLNVPEKKMSKSDESEFSRIELTDKPDDIASKIKRAKTDSERGLSYDPVNRPGVSNLIDIHRAFTGKTKEEICAEHEHVVFLTDYKKHLTDVVIEELSPIRSEIERLLSDRHGLQTVVSLGNQKAREIAEENMKCVRSLVGFT